MWDAVDALFPIFLSVADFLLILQSVDVTDRSGGLGLDHLGPNLADRLQSVAQVEQLTAGLLDRFETGLNSAIERELPSDHPLLSTQRRQAGVFSNWFHRHTRRRLRSTRCCVWE